MAAALKRKRKPRNAGRKGKIPGPRKSDRVEIRLTSEQKRLVEEASAIKGMTVSSFVTHSVLEDAKAAIEEERVIVLNAEQSRLVAEMLMRPPAPSKVLVQAFKDYCKRRLRPGF